jgi:transposase
MQKLEELGWQYIFGVPMRKYKEVREDVLTRGGRYKDVRTAVEKLLKVKEIKVHDCRYVLCLNAEQARKDAIDRETMVEALKEKLSKDEKSLIGNKGYRKLLKAVEHGFRIDFEKIKREAKYDGKFVLTTNTKSHSNRYYVGADPRVCPEQGDALLNLLNAPWYNTKFNADEVALKYKQLWRVEELFRKIKSILHTRPIYHRCDETIRGHVFCSFLALILMKELQDRLLAKDCKHEWNDLVKDIDNLQEIEIEHEGKRFLLRTETKGLCGKAFLAAGVAMPQTVRQISS